MATVKTITVKHADIGGGETACGLATKDLPREKKAGLWGQVTCPDCQEAAPRGALMPEPAASNPDKPETETEPPNLMNEARAVKMKAEAADPTCGVDAVWIWGEGKRLPTSECSPCMATNEQVRDDYEGHTHTVPVGDKKFCAVCYQRKYE
ncbi:MAG TPA: hypothetical protein VEI97_15890 [bacterium]|nr:hypothetical protein [bacterium]